MSVTKDFEALQGHFEIDLQVEHVFFEHGCAKKMTLPKGYRIGTHKHDGGHQSFYFGGPALLKVDGEADRVLPAPYGTVNLPGGKHHEIHALEDVMWICILETDEIDPAKIDATVIEKA